MSKWRFTHTFNDGTTHVEEKEMPDHVTQEDMEQWSKEADEYANQGPICKAAGIVGRTKVERIEEWPEVIDR